LSYPGVWIAVVLSSGLHVFFFFALSLRAPTPISSIPPALHIKLVIATIQPSSIKIVAQKEASKTAIENNSTLDEKEFIESGGPNSATADRSPNSFFSKSVEYFYSNDVDARTAPVSDWVLRSEEIIGPQSVTLKITVFVSASGQLDHYELLDSTASKELTMLLMRDLKMTRFSPAQKGGRSVASQRDVEITIDNHTVPYGIRLPSNPPQ
jgi:hypothetical protein